MTSVLAGLMVFLVVVYGLRRAWHAFFRTLPPDPAVERERLRQDIQRSYRIARWMTKRMLHR